MRLIGAIFGLILILVILRDTFETIILPRRVTRRIKLTNVFYSSIWVPWSMFVRHISNGQRREKSLGLFGPLSLLILLGFWALGLILGYALLLWAANAKLSSTAESITFSTYLYLSGVTFFTLGYGDIAPVFPLGRVLAVIEAGNGFGLFAIVISYLPILYQAFSRREASISLLDARAGSPSSAVELLRRHRAEDSFDDLNRLLSEWERWSAELLESHLSYPVLCYFRSQHDNQSWLAAFAAVLDVSALLVAYGTGTAKWQAQLTFAISRHAIADLCEVLRVRPLAPVAERLPLRDLAEVRGLLTESGTGKCTEAGDLKLSELRSMYEPQLNDLSRRLRMPLPSWGVGAKFVENRKRTAWDRISSESAGPMAPDGGESGHF